MANTYLRPNLTKEEASLLTEILERDLQALPFTDPSFDSLYQLRIKLLKAKPIKA